MAIRFPELSELLGHDADKGRPVALASYRGAAMDLLGLHSAPAATAWQVASSLAQRTRIRLHFSTTTRQVSSSGLGLAQGYARHQAVITELLRHTEDFAR